MSQPTKLIRTASMILFIFTLLRLHCILVVREVLATYLMLEELLKTVEINIQVLTFFPAQLQYTVVVCIHRPGL